MESLILKHTRCTLLLALLLVTRFFFCFEQDDSVLIDSMDGCFGLCRNKEKGHNLGTPKHGTLLFADIDDVDNFVNNYGKAGADMEQV